MNKGLLAGLVLVMLLGSVWAAVPALYGDGTGVEDGNVAAEPEPVHYPAEIVYLIVAVALILAAVTYYLYTTPSKVELKEMKARAKLIETARKKAAKKPKKKKKK